jgi:hypothetical protein
MPDTAQTTPRDASTRSDYTPREPPAGTECRIPERQWPSIAELALDTAFRDRQAKLSAAGIVLRQ